MYKVLDMYKVLLSDSKNSAIMIVAEQLFFDSECYPDIVNEGVHFICQSIIAVPSIIMFNMLFLY